MFWDYNSSNLWDQSNRMIEALRTSKDIFKSFYGQLQKSWFTTRSKQKMHQKTYYYYYYKVNFHTVIEIQIQIQPQLKKSLKFQPPPPSSKRVLLTKTLVFCNSNYKFQFFQNFNLPPYPISSES